MTTEPRDAPEGLPPGAERRLADLRALLEVARHLSATHSLQPLLDAIERSCLRVLECERVSIFLHDRTAGQLYTRVATGLGPDAPPLEIRIPATHGIVGEVLRTGTVLNIPDAYADPRFNRDVDRQTGYRTRSLLACPLPGLDGIAVGVVEVLNKHGGSFGTWDRELIQDFAAQAGVALQRQLLLEERAARQRLEADLAVARVIQQQLLPTRPPTARGYDVAGWNQPADQTGGDFFDFQELDDGRLAITLADVTGHGLGPSLLAAECHALLRSSLALTASLERAVPLVNRLLASHIPEDRFITAFVGLLAPEHDRCLYVSAGQGPLLFYRAVDDTVSLLNVGGLPLGILADALYDQADSVAFGPGDLLLLCTDGFFEWPDGRGDRFGCERVQRLVRQFHHLPAADLIQQLVRTVRAFGQAVPQPDDLTAVVIKKR